MLDKKQKKVIDGPELVIDQDNKYREVNKTGDITTNETTEPCPCKWSDN